MHETAKAVQHRLERLRDGYPTPDTIAKYLTAHGYVGHAWDSMTNPLARYLADGVPDVVVHATRLWVRVSVHGEQVAQLATPNNLTGFLRSLQHDRYPALIPHTKG